MPSNLFRERAHLLGERCSLKRGGNGSRIRKVNAWLEVGIKRHIRRRRALISVGQLLFETKRDLAECAQCSSFYPEQNYWPRINTDAHRFVSACIRVYPWLICLSPNCDNRITVTHVWHCRTTSA